MIPTHGSTRRIGIEIEVESNAVSQGTADAMISSNGRNSVWEVVHEGSLRAGSMGWEVRTCGSGGLSIDKVQQGMSELYPLLISSTGIWRAAVHVHVSLEGISQHCKGLLYGLLYCLDDSLFAEFAPARRESNFCVPLDNDVQRTLSVVQAFLRNHDPDIFKYTSINPLPIRGRDCDGDYHTLGTFEFRHMQTPRFDTRLGSVTDGLTEIFRYACTCTSLVDWAYGELSDSDTLSSTINKWGSKDKLLWINHNRAHRYKLELNPSAVLNLLDKFHGSDVVPDDVDKLSLYAVTKRPERCTQQERVDEAIRRMNSNTFGDNILEEMADVPLGPLVRTQAEEAA